MAQEQQDQDQKTEEPTSKRLEDAREEGQLPISMEIKTWFMLAGGGAGIMLIGPYLGVQLKESLVRYFALADQLSIADSSLKNALFDTLAMLAPALGMLALLLLICAFAGTMVQTGPFMATKLIEPKVQRISPLAGFKRIFSMHSVVELVKGMLKITIIGVVVFMVTRPLFTEAELLNGLEPLLQLQVTFDYTVKIFIAAVSALTIIAGLDYLYQRFEYFKNVRMTKQEVKEEMKQTEGDPMARARLRAIRMERARRRMMTKVPEADVVVTNPTHFAVALKYEQGKMHAPMVLAKGQDIIALKIREVAGEHNVPLVENPPLARALYSSCDLDQEIPVEHYKAVAEIISYVYRLKAKVKK